MIDRASIINWGVAHPWPRQSFIEQDLVICRAIVSIYSDPFLAEALAFRGGTALHKLHLSPQVRYSEDIDLVQTSPGPIKPIVERLDAALSWIPGKSFDTRRFGFRMRFRYDSELPPIEPMRLKVEVNSTVGAGDSMLAAMACGNERGMSFRDTCALATAFSAAAVTTAGTQPAEMEVVRDLLQRVCITEI